MGENDLEDGRGTWLWIEFYLSETSCRSLRKNPHHSSSFRWIYPKMSIKQALVRSGHRGVGDDDKKSDEDDDMKIQMMSRHEFQL